MPLPWSHKKPAEAHVEHWQPPAHGPMTSRYGQEKGEHPNRKVAKSYDSDPSTEAFVARYEREEAYRNTMNTPKGFRPKG